MSCVATADSRYPDHREAANGSSRASGEAGRVQTGQLAVTGIPYPCSSPQVPMCQNTNQCVLTPGSLCGKEKGLPMAAGCGQPLRSRRQLSLSSPARAVVVVTPFWIVSLENGEKLAKGEPAEENPGKSPTVGVLPTVGRTTGACSLTARFAVPTPRGIIGTDKGQSWGRR